MIRAQADIGINARRKATPLNHAAEVITSVTVTTKVSCSSGMYISVALKNPT